MTLSAASLTPNDFSLSPAARTFQEFAFKRVVASQTKHIPFREEVRPETMKSDLVPCYYTGQDYRREQPADLLPRHEVRKYKDQKLGKFIASGQFFLFFARRVVRVLHTVWEGRPSSQSILAFLKTNSYGDKLHYEIPLAGDRGIFARHHRKRIHVSSRVAPQFRIQQIPA